MHNRRAVLVFSFDEIAPRKSGFEAGFRQSAHGHCVGHKTIRLFLLPYSLKKFFRTPARINQIVADKFYDFSRQFHLGQIFFFQFLNFFLELPIKISSNIRLWFAEFSPDFNGLFGRYAQLILKNTFPGDLQMPISVLIFENFGILSGRIRVEIIRVHRPLIRQRQSHSLIAMDFAG